MFKALVLLVGAFLFLGVACGDTIVVSPSNTPAPTAVDTSDCHNISCEGFVLGYLQSPDTTREEAICFWYLMAESVGSEDELIEDVLERNSEQLEQYTEEVFEDVLINYAPQFWECVGGIEFGESNA